MLNLFLLFVIFIAIPARGLSENEIVLLQQALDTHNKELVPIPGFSCCHGLLDGTRIILLPEQEADVLIQRDPSFSL